MRKHPKILLFATGLLLFLALIGYRSNLIIVQVTRENFVGGEISAWNDVLRIPSGSGTVWRILKASSGEAELTIDCQDGRTATDGYLESGPLQYLKVIVTDCRFENFGVPTSLILTPLDLLDVLVPDHR